MLSPFTFPTLRTKWFTFMDYWDVPSKRADAAIENRQPTPTLDEMQKALVPFVVGKLEHNMIASATQNFVAPRFQITPPITSEIVFLFHSYGHVPDWLQWNGELSGWIQRPPFLPLLAESSLDYKSQYLKAIQMELRTFLEFVSVFVYSRMTPFENLILPGFTGVNPNNPNAVMRNLYAYMFLLIQTDVLRLTKFVSLSFPVSKDRTGFSPKFLAESFIDIPLLERSGTKRYYEIINQDFGEGRLLSRKAGVEILQATITSESGRQIRLSVPSRVFYTQKLRATIPARDPALAPSNQTDFRWLRKQYGIEGTRRHKDIRQWRNGQLPDLAEMELRESGETTLAFFGEDMHDSYWYSTELAKRLEERPLAFKKGDYIRERYWRRLAHNFGPIWAMEMIPRVTDYNLAHAQMLNRVSQSLRSAIDRIQLARIGDPPIQAPEDYDPLHFVTLSRTTIRNLLTGARFLWLRDHLGHMAIAWTIYLRSTKKIRRRERHGHILLTSSAADIIGEAALFTDKAKTVEDIQKLIWLYYGAALMKIIQLFNLSWAKTVSTVMGTAAHARALYWTRKGNSFYIYETQACALGAHLSSQDKAFIHVLNACLWYDRRHLRRARVRTYQYVVPQFDPGRFFEEGGLCLTYSLARLPLLVMGHTAPNLPVDIDDLRRKMIALFGVYSGAVFRYLYKARHIPPGPKKPTAMQVLVPIQIELRILRAAIGKNNLDTLLNVL